MHLLSSQDTMVKKDVDEALVHAGAPASRHASAAMRPDATGRA